MKEARDRGIGGSRDQVNGKTDSGPQSNPPARTLHRARFASSFGFWALAVPLVAFLGFIMLMFYYLFSNGLGVMSWRFLTQPPLNGMTEGGIWPCIAGTVPVSYTHLTLPTIYSV